MMETIERIIEFVMSLGLVVPLVVFLLLRTLFSKSSQEEQPERPSTPPQEQTEPRQAPSLPIPGFPFGGPAWMGMNEPMLQPEPAPSSVEAAPASQWGGGFDRAVESPSDEWGHAFDRPDEATDDALRWGSAFESDAQGEPIRWTSAFDDQTENTYGFKGAKWGGTFPPRSSEPVIQVD